MLHGAGLQAVADVRRFAASRRHPQYNGGRMAQALRDAGIDYVAMPDLGGRREPRADSPHTALKTPGFRGYADHMDTAVFARAFERLAAIARDRPTAMMCAEADWRDCHRSFISDAFKSKGWRVIHLRSTGAQEEHPYTAVARVIDGRLMYPKPADAQGSLF